MTATAEDPLAEATGPFDELVEALRLRRHEAGGTSYAVIASAVSSARQAEGQPMHQARVARSTVYDLFRTGRRRIDLGLLLDVVRALGADEHEVERWREEYLRTLSLEPAELSEPVELSEPMVEDESAAPAAIVSVMTRAPRSRRLSRPVMLAVASAAVGVNLFGVFTSYNLSLPLYLDMIGTAIAAIVLGPWWGAGVGLTTNLLSASVNGWTAVPFAIVNVAGALVWGYGIRRFGMGRTVARFFMLNVLVALVCSAIAVPIVLWVFGGATGGGADDVTETFHLLLNGLAAAVVSANLITSLADKMISGFIALLVLESSLGQEAAGPSRRVANQA